MTKQIQHLFLLAVSAAVCFSCKGKAEPEIIADPVVPVTLTSIDTSAVESFTDLNATASYLVKNVIKANATGYLVSVNVTPNDYVRKGQALFSLKTKEAQVLGNTVNKIDPGLHFGNAIVVRATSNGYVSAINVQKGDYVQEGDSLAVISDADSFGVVLSLPYEMRPYITANKMMDVILPDGKVIKARVDKFLPTVDAGSQTQSVFLKPQTQKQIPENLIVKVRITRSSGSGTVSLPKDAVLGDETETQFWIMKMVDNETAVKIPIRKGMESQDRIEIVSPVLTINDRILLTGNYGVADTIKVRVTTKQR